LRSEGSTRLPRGGRSPRRPVQGFESRSSRGQQLEVHCAHLMSACTRRASRSSSGSSRSRRCALSAPKPSPRSQRKWPRCWDVRSRARTRDGDGRASRRETGRRAHVPGAGSAAGHVLPTPRGQGAATTADAASAAHRRRAARRARGAARAAVRGPGTRRGLRPLAGREPVRVLGATEYRILAANAEVKERRDQLADAPVPPPPPTAAWINPPTPTSSDVEEAH